MREFNVIGRCRKEEHYMVEKGQYFTINRARQHGISFEGIGAEPFEWVDKSITAFRKLDSFLNLMCKDKKVVLIIDETDKTSSKFVFLRFAGMLRGKYLEKDISKKAAFRSTVLCGVYDIMSFSVPETTTMLLECEKDHKTGMDIEAISKGLEPAQAATLGRAGKLFWIICA